MTESEIIAAIAAIAHTHLDWDGPIEARLRLIEDIGLDSIKLMTMAIEIENHFQICLDPAQDGELRTVGDLAHAVKREIVAKQASQ